MEHGSPDGRQVGVRGRRAGAIALSLGAHAAIAAALVVTWTRPVAAPEERPIVVSLVALPEPEPPASPAPKLRPAIAPPLPSERRVRRTAPSGTVATTPRARISQPSPSPSELAAADQAGVEGAGSGRDTGGGGGGGDCDMAGRLQSALRKDPLVRAAVANAGRDSSAGRAIWVWNGDWVQSHSEDGKGLAAIREALMWEIAFAPAPCRARPMRGLVLLAVNDAPGAPRLAVGLRNWRWSDLLTPTRYSDR
jgi:hypothetical protein